MFSRTGTWERDVIALRIVPITPDGEWFEAIQSRDAGWLVRRDARVAAMGTVLGILGFVGEDLHFRKIGVVGEARRDAGNDEESSSTQ